MVCILISHFDRNERRSGYAHTNNPLPPNSELLTVNVTQWSKKRAVGKAAEIALENKEGAPTNN